MEYNFQEFTKIRAKVDKRISVTKSYSFGYPQGFYRDHNIKDYKYVILFFDPEKLAVGFHFTNDESKKNKFTIIHGEKSGSIVARSFFKNYEIDPKKYANRYEPIEIEKEGIGKIFVIHLKEKNSI